MDLINVCFLKDGIYRGIKYKKDETIKMSQLDLKSYIDCKVVKIAIPVKEKHQNSIKFENMAYRDLQKLCKEKGIIAVGKKEELIKLLKEQDLKVEK